MHTLRQHSFHTLTIILALAALWLSGARSLPRAAAGRPAAHSPAPLFATITVNSTADGAPANNGACTLREAIINANANNQSGSTDCAAGMAGLDNIEFNLGAGTPSIAVTGSALPAITQAVFINGNTGGATRVELNGAAAGAGADGLTISAGGSTIRALVINRFSLSGINLNTNGGNLIANSYIGTDATGMLSAGFGNGANGIFISNSANNTVGGTMASERNVVAGNADDGVELTGAGATGNRVSGNYIGLAADGTTARANGDEGILIEGAPGNIIGGLTAGERNIISGNSGNGVFARGATATGNLVQGNFIGTDVTGTVDLGNGGDGVEIDTGASNNTVGGTGAGARNIISGNGDAGVFIDDSDSTGNRVEGNYIGTDVTGTADLGNTDNGVELADAAVNNTIGGTSAAARNIISGNENNGVEIGGAGTNGNVIQGNFIGADVNGTAALGNTSDGVQIDDGAANNIIGGTMAGARNVISGNARNGVYIEDVNTNNNLIQGNFIGTNAAGTGALGNLDDGVEIFEGTGNFVGGTAGVTPGACTGACNVIAFNAEDGVDIDAPPAAPISNPILSNSIYSNGTTAQHIGIELQDDPAENGVTPNDANDPDTGPNNYQNFPVLTCAQSANGQTTIQGSLNSTPFSIVIIQFFANSTCDTAGNGEGQTFLGQTVETLDDMGNVAFTATVPVAVAAGQFITATATMTDPDGNPSDTSEFSACRAVSATPTVTINDVTMAEGNAGTTNFTFTVTLNNTLNTCAPVTVNYTTANGTATAPADYAFTSGMLTFNPPFMSNTLTQMITVQVVGELLVEANETFFVNLTATNATVTDAQGQGTITNDDAATISITDVSQIEGNAGTSTFTFTVSLNNPSSEQVTVNYATANGTATAGSDYVTTNGTLTFVPGDTSETITVTVNGDLVVESNETFFVNLSGVTGANAAVPDPTFADAQGQGTINNDDAATIAITDVSQAEGNAGTSNFSFTVTLNNPSAEQVTVNYTTADGTATAPSDYALTSGTLTFAPGDTSKTISVPVNGDLVVEGNETFFVNLSTITGNNALVPDPTFADAQGQGTISNDDAATIAITDVSQAEGNAGTSNFTFTVTLNNPSSEQITVNYATANGTATAGSDYVTTNGTLTFAPGVTTQTINVTVNGDLVVEPNETFLVNLSTITGANAAVPDPTFADNQGQGTINNDDLATIAITDVSQAEGAAGTSTFTFTVSLSNPSSEQVTANFATANGTATAGSDYVATSGTLTFAPGVTTQTINVTVNGDLVAEPNETFFVNLSGIAGANAAVPDPTFAKAQGLGTILNDDGLPPVLTVSIADPFGCTGPGDVLNVTAPVANPNATVQALSFTAMLPATLFALPGTCATSVPGLVCVIAPYQRSVTVTGPLPGNQTVTITYQVQVGDAASGAQLCIDSTASFTTSVQASVQACATLNCPPLGPGETIPQASLINDTKPGSILIYNAYTSSASGGGNFTAAAEMAAGTASYAAAASAGRANTRISLTNTHPSLPVFVHLFFVDGATCAAADSYLCLTPNQTASFLTSDLDPGTSGYLVAVATDRTGCPINFNYLIGSAFVRYASGHCTNLAAEAIAAIAGGLPACNLNSDTALLRFDGASYDALPHVVAVDNVASRADGNDTLLILNRLGGSLATGAAPLGTVVGIFYDDAENALSFVFTAGTCQARGSFSNSFPRTAPRFETFIPAGRSGWLKLYIPPLVGVSGAVINLNANGFNQGHNLHKLTLTNTTVYTIPVFPPAC